MVAALIAAALLDVAVTTLAMVATLVGHTIAILVAGVVGSLGGEGHRGDDLYKQIFRVIKWAAQNTSSFSSYQELVHLD